MDPNIMNNPAGSTPPPAAPAPGVQIVNSATPPATPIVADQGADIPAADTTTAGNGATTDFFKSINWLEMGFMILGATALYYTIYYYRYKTKEDKIANSEARKDIDELQMNLRTVMGRKYKTLAS